MPHTTLDIAEDTKNNGDRSAIIRLRGRLHIAPLAGRDECGDHRHIRVPGRIADDGD